MVYGTKRVVENVVSKRRLRPPIVEIAKTPDHVPFCIDALQDLGRTEDFTNEPRNVSSGFTACSVKPVYLVCC